MKTMKPSTSEMRAYEDHEAFSLVDMKPSYEVQKAFNLGNKGPSYEDHKAIHL